MGRHCGRIARLDRGTPIDRYYLHRFAILLALSSAACGTLDNGGAIYGDVEAASVVRAGTITGTLTVPAGSKHTPADQAIADYIAKATTLPKTSSLDKRVLSPSFNPFGSPNADGIYYMNTLGSDLTITNSRIQGTLIVRTGGGTVILDSAVFLHPARWYNPVLIVVGNAVIKCYSGSYSLSEWLCGTNFNPAGAPYQGTWDADIYDVYPNEIQGLVHIQGSLRLQNTARIVGVVICQGTVTCEEQNTIVYDPDLAAHPPEGYTYVAGMKVSPGSFAQGVH